MIDFIRCRQVKTYDCCFYVPTGSSRRVVINKLSGREKNKDYMTMVLKSLTRL